MLNRFSHQTTCIETRRSVRGKQQPSTDLVRGPSWPAWVLTGLPSRYTRKSVSLIPEKRRPWGASTAHAADPGSAHASGTRPRGGKLVTLHRQGACTGGSERADSSEVSGKAGSGAGRKTEPCLQPPHLCQARSRPVSQHTPPPPVSMVTFWAPFPGRGSSLRPYLIVDRPVPGFGSEFIVLGFEAIVPLQESGKEKLVKTEIERTPRNARHRDP